MTGFERSHWLLEGDRLSDLNVEVVSDAAINLRHEGGGGDVGMTMIGLRDVVRCASMADVYTLAHNEGAEREPRLVEIHNGDEVFDT